jgi:hypothetical protein
MKTVLLPLVLLVTVFFSGCANLAQQRAAHEAMVAQIRAEKPGNYFIARRYYKVDYKFWGYIRKPGQPWTEAKLVMLNENKKLAPDREGGTLGSDNGYEYKFLGYFSGDTVYEPASNGFYPEFVLTGYELRSANPGPIFAPGSPALDPTRRVIVTPY